VTDALFHILLNKVKKILDPNLYPNQPQNLIDCLLSESLRLPTVSCKFTIMFRVTLLSDR